MNIVTPAAKARKHEATGYALYVAKQPISACQNEMQRVGWRNAYTGHNAAMSAAADAETTAYLAKHVPSVVEGASR